MRWIPSERAAYWLVLLGCIAVSALGIWLSAIRWHNLTTADGGRGGALAVMAALIALFLSRSSTGVTITAMSIRHRLRHLARRSGPLVEDELLKERIDRLEREVSSIVHALKVGRTDAQDSLLRQNVFLALASAAGTLAWGFGDWAAICLQKHGWVGH